MVDPGDIELERPGTRTQSHTLELPVSRWGRTTCVFGLVLLAFLLAALPLRGDVSLLRAMAGLFVIPVYLHPLLLVGLVGHLLAAAFLRGAAHTIAFFLVTLPIWLWLSSLFVG